MLACPMGGPIFSTFTASGVRYSHHNFPTKSQLQSIAARPFRIQTSIRPLPIGRPFPTAQPVPVGPVPRQSAPSPPERIPFPSGEDLHRDTPVIILPRAGPNLYGAEPHDSPLLSHTHTHPRTSRGHICILEARIQSNHPLLIQPLRRGRTEYYVWCFLLSRLPPITTTSRPLPSFPPHPPIQAAIVHLSSSPSRFPIPPPPPPPPPKNAQNANAIMQPRGIS